MTHRNLTKNEITTLEKQGCYCRDWSSIQVADNFTTESIHQVRLEGKVKLGRLAGTVAPAAEKPRPAGIYKAFLRDCEISGPAYISEVGRLEGYRVENDVIIENVSSLTVDGPTTFGNGTEIEVLNEGGGRELLIYDQLTAQIAYLMVNYRHEREMIANLSKLIEAYSDRKRSGRGVIGTGSCIRDAQIIRNVQIGPFASINGVQLLSEGTIASVPEAPVRIGEGVIARHFIIHSGSVVDTGAVLDKCFVGQGVRIGKQYSAEGSVFFANCEGFHGEAVSLFAGPYTVTHHKSSLLIAGMFSFFNAGSGTNQSNHMYKLGPIHQGTLERGCKTGSFAYLLWPSRVGAFSVVMDKHGVNFDSSDFPFSYLTVEDGKTTLTPAMNLFTVGTKRDTDKWPKRDRRQDPDKLDLIRFELFSPYIVGKMIRGSEILQGLYEKTPKEHKYVKYKGLVILRLLLKTCRKYYQLALRKYFGEQLLHRLADYSFKDTAALRHIFEIRKNGTGEWVDIAGLLAPQSAVQGIVDELKAGRVESVDQLRGQFQDLYDDYEEYAWSWYAQTLQAELGIDVKDITDEQLTKLIEDWKDSSLKLNNMILKDAEKEFDQNSRIGFGLDGDESVQVADFSVVRGNYDDNSFVRSLRAENHNIEKTSAEWVGRLEEVFGV